MTNSTNTTEKAPVPAETKRNTKHQTVLRLLKRKTGASTDELKKATDWQPHSIRAYISATIRKKLGLTVVSETTAERGRVYRIVKATK